MNINGWEIYYFKPFAKALDKLEADVAKLAARDPKRYVSHPKTKLLASVYDAITKRVPANPKDKAFELGKTLVVSYKHWKRVKKGMPDRYRLFFRFATTPNPLIIFVWLNDEDSLRKAGSKTDVYEAFKQKLARGVVPDSIDSLLNDSQENA